MWDEGWPNSVPSLPKRNKSKGRRLSVAVLRVRRKTQQDLDIGCLLLGDVRFFSDTAGPPPGFAASIVRGKGYDLADSAVVFNFGEPLQRLVAESVELDLTEPWHRPGLVFGDPHLA